MIRTETYQFQIKKLFERLREKFASKIMLSDSQIIEILDEEERRMQRI